MSTFENSVCHGGKINRMSDIFKTYYLHELLKSNLKYNIAPIIEK